MDLQKGKVFATIENIEMKRYILSNYNKIQADFIQEVILLCQRANWD